MHKPCCNASGKTLLIYVAKKQLDADVFRHNLVGYAITHVGTDDERAANAARRRMGMAVRKIDFRSSYKHFVDTTKTKGA